MRKFLCLKNNRTNDRHPDQIPSQLEHVPDPWQGHAAGAAGAVVAAWDGGAVSVAGAGIGAAASEGGVAGEAGCGDGGATDGGVCAWVLLASASGLQGGDDAIEQRRVLAGEVCAQCRERPEASGGLAGLGLEGGGPVGMRAEGSAAAGGAPAAAPGDQESKKLTQKAQGAQGTQTGECHSGLALG